MIAAPTVFGVFGALLCASALGVFLQRKLAEQHKSRETGDHVRLIISILVTFTAVVLGLLISNVKSSYDEFDARLSAYASDITELDVRLREYGEDAAPIREKLRTYVAAAIADTWRNEPPPVWQLSKVRRVSGLERRQLGDLLVAADMAIRKLDPSDTFRKRLVTQIENAMSDTMNQRRLLIGTSARYDLLESSRRHDGMAGHRLRGFRRHRATQRGGVRDNLLVRALVLVRDFLHS